MSQPSPLVMARPGDLLRCGVILGEVAEQIGSAVSVSRRSSQVSWYGPTGTAYQHRLGRLTGKLDRAAVAFGEACDVLIAYSRALAAAKELAGQAEVIARAAEMTSLGAVQAGGLGVADPVAAAQAGQLQRRAIELLAQAEAMEATAARRTAITLHALAGEAPHESPGTAASRIVDDIGTSLAAQVDGAVALGRSLWHSLPGVGRDDQRALGRHQALQAAKQVVQPWLVLEQLLNDVQDGRPGLAAGTVIGAALTRKVAPIGKAGEPLFEGHQFAPNYLRGLPDQALVIRDHAEAWALAHEAKAFQDSIAALRATALAQGRNAVPRDWLDRPLDLRQHEASGGHLLLKHVDARIELLQWRLRLEKKAGERSTFESVAEATRLVSESMQLRRQSIDTWLATTSPRLTLDVPLVNAHGTVLHASGSVQQGTRVTIVLMRHADGGVFVQTAYLGSD